MLNNKHINKTNKDWLNDSLSNNGKFQELNDNIEALYNKIAKTPINKKNSTIKLFKI